MNKRIVFLILITMLAALSSCSKEKGKIGQQAEVDLRNVHMKTVQPFYYVALQHVGSYDEYEAVINDFLSRFAQADITPAGPMMGLYFNSPNQVPENELSWAIGFPLTDSVRVEEPLETAKWDKTQVISYSYTGSPENTKPAYDVLDQYMARQNLVLDGPVVERYLDPDLTIVPQDSFHIEIWFPVTKPVS